MRGLAQILTLAVVLAAMLPAHANNLDAETEAEEGDSPLNFLQAMADVNEGQANQLDEEVPSAKWRGWRKLENVGRKVIGGAGVVAAVGTAAGLGGLPIVQNAAVLDNVARAVRRRRRRTTTPPPADDEGAE